MHASPSPEEPLQWVLWNGSSAILVMATIGRIEQDAGGRSAWMAAPFDMVGPFNLDELQARGRITFAACMVMSRQRWQEDQAELRREAYALRRAAQERLNAQQARFHAGRRGGRTHGQPFDERSHRETLNLPADGELAPSEIKKAFRRLAQKAHPDVGGSHDQFLRITEARNALLGRAS
jgi:hypothetical protein